MQRHKHHASNPEILTPKICATAAPCPSEPSVPRPSNPNPPLLPQRPDVSFVILQLQAGIDEQLAVLLVAIELLDYRRKCRWHSGDERLARDLGAGLQDRSFRRCRLQPVIE